jgi:D-sedoheptulose 7-phosphate isomerase
MRFVSTYLKQVQEAIQAMSARPIEQVVQTLLEAGRQGRTVFLCGNGGSAATASHMACDLAKGTISPGQYRFRVVSLNDNIPLMTAWGNDTDFSNIFAEQLKSLVSEGDVLMAISTSGNSPNVLKAVQVAQEAGATSIAMTNEVGGQLRDMADICLNVPCTIIEQVEDIHMVLAHCIISAVRDGLRRSLLAVSTGAQESAAEMVTELATAD